MDLIASAPTGPKRGDSRPPPVSRRFVPSAWSPPRDVLLWNWQANVSAFSGRRLKMASGVAWFRKTARAENLLTAWAQAMAYAPNVNAPDDQTLDLLVNEDGWMDRVEFGWCAPPRARPALPRGVRAHPTDGHAALATAAFALLPAASAAMPTSRRRARAVAACNRL